MTRYVLVARVTRGLAGLFQVRVDRFPVSAATGGCHDFVSCRQGAAYPGDAPGIGTALG